MPIIWQTARAFVTPNPIIIYLVLFQARLFHVYIAIDNINCPLNVNVIKHLEQVKITSSSGDTSQSAI